MSDQELDRIILIINNINNPNREMDYTSEIASLTSCILTAEQEERLKNDVYNKDELYKQFLGTTEVAKTIDEKSRILRENAVELYKEIEGQCIEICGELNGNSDRSKYDITDEINDLSWKLAFICECDLKSRLLPVDFTTNILQGNATIRIPGNDDGYPPTTYRDVFNYLIKNDTNTLADFLVGENKENVWSKVWEFLEGRGFTDEQIAETNFWRNAGNYSMDGYGHNIDKMLDNLNGQNLPTNVGVDGKYYINTRYTRTKGHISKFPPLVDLTNSLIGRKIK